MEEQVAMSCEQIMKMMTMDCSWGGTVSKTERKKVRRTEVQKGTQLMEPLKWHSKLVFRFFFRFVLTRTLLIMIFIRHCFGPRNHRSLIIDCSSDHFIGRREKNTINLRNDLISWGVFSRQVAGLMSGDSTSNELQGITFWH